MLLLEYLDYVYTPSRLLDASPHTVRLYRLSIEAFRRSLDRPATLDDLTNDLLRLHMAKRIAAKKSPATANKDRAQLLALWRHATVHGHKTTWPDVRELREPVRAPIAWLPGECEKLIDQINREKGMVGAVPAPVFWSNLLAILLDTGERIGAVMQIEWGWISFEGGFLSVPAEARKGRARDKVFKLSPATVAGLRKLKEHQVRGLVFDFPHNRACLWRKYAEILRKAGLPTDRKSKFHRIRKTVATAVYAAGGDAQRALDHSDSRTTESYLDPRITAENRTPEYVASYRNGG